LARFIEIHGPLDRRFSFDRVVAVIFAFPVQNQRIGGVGGQAVSREGRRVAQIVDTVDGFKLDLLWRARIIGHHFIDAYAQAEPRVCGRDCQLVKSFIAAELVHAVLGHFEKEHRI